jgi:hypothetical protein
VVLTPELLTRMSIGPDLGFGARHGGLDAVDIGHVELDHVGVAALAFDARAQLLELRSTRRLASTTAAPARASVLANWAPRPLEAPVTKATRPERSML